MHKTLPTKCLGWFP